MQCGGWPTNPASGLYSDEDRMGWPSVLERVGQGIYGGWRDLTVH